MKVVRIIINPLVIVFVLPFLRSLTNKMQKNTPEKMEIVTKTNLNIIIVFLKSHF